MPDEERDWFFSFGPDHVHPQTGESLAGCVVRIHGTRESSRVAMFNAFGPHWSWQSSTAAEAGVMKFKMREIPMPAEPFETARKAKR
jgi:hypothetical protein